MTAKRKKATPLTYRSMKMLRESGWCVDKTEQYIHQARRKKDLYGIIDVLAVRGETTMGVQVTSRGEIARRKRKILDSPAFPLLIEAGWKIVIHGWDKYDSRWRCKVVRVRPEPETGTV